MGFSDRRYDRFDVPSFAPEWTAVMTIIVVNVAIWVSNQLLLASGEFSLNRLLALDGNFFEHPWKLWELVTCGFAHDERNPWHLVFNMLALWFFGRVVEELLGRAEFCRFYLLAIVIAALAWLVSLQFGGRMLPGRAPFLVGASGAIMAVLAVFIWHFPNQMVLIWGVLPVPAWALGVLYFLSDVQGAASGGGQVANVAHLAGAIFGAIYAWRGLDLGSLFEPLERWLSRRRSFKVVRDDDRDVFGTPIRRPTKSRSAEELDDAKLQEEVDRILEKISRSGEASLSASDRETLALASRRLKERIR